MNDDQKQKLKQASSGFGGFTTPGQLISTSVQIQLKPTAEQKKALADLPTLPRDKRVLGAQDLAWALLNSPAFLFNH